jgi:ubiquinone/menaquinone biosynthesis C-methylase UbiE
VEEGRRSPSIDDDVLGYYERGEEASRLLSGLGRLEFLRTQEILRRVLPRPPARIADVGGGPGVHAAWLAEDGYAVTLLDPVPLHVEQARAVASDQPHASFLVAAGDARTLPLEDGSQDAALLLGPLYHLIERADRVGALGEARRVVRPGGLVAVGAISRIASVLDGVARDLLGDPDFRAMTIREMGNGQHRAVEGRWFTTAYFHRVDELRTECVDAGLEVVELLAVEGPAAILPDLGDRMADDRLASLVLDSARIVEHDADMLGATSHFLAIARRPDVRPGDAP